jgi:iron donor protein CyaY
MKIDLHLAWKTIPPAAQVTHYPMDDQEFQRRADEELNSLYRKLTRASDSADFEADFNSGALAIEFEDPPGKFVVSPNSPVRQIWVSAHSKSFKLEWNGGRGAFVLPDTGQTLAELIGSAISQQLGEEITL